MKKILNFSGALFAVLFTVLVLLVFPMYAATIPLPSPEQMEKFHTNLPEILVATVGVLEVLTRIIPSKNDHSIIHKVIRVLNILVPNRTRDTNGQPARFSLNVTKRRRNGTISAD